MPVVRVDAQISKETVVRLKAKHVDGISTLLKEAMVVLLDDFLSKLKKGLGI